MAIFLSGIWSRKTNLVPIYNTLIKIYNPLIKIIWTTIFASILILIAVPSLTIGSFPSEMSYLVVWMVVTVLLLLVYAYIVFYIGLRFNRKTNPVPSKHAHLTLIQIIWMAIAALILSVIAVLSFQVLYYSVCANC